MSYKTNWNALNNAASLAILQADRLDILLEDLGCRLKKSRNGRTYRGPCRVHGGDSHSMSLEIGEDDALPIRWNCFSHQCHEKYKPSLLGLVRGILTAQRCREVHPRDAADYLHRFTGGMAHINASITTPRNAVPPKLLNFSREAVRQALAIPSPYFLARGFSPKVLDAFDVGESSKRGKAVVPLYDNNDGDTCIGYLARSYQPQCDECGKHHYGRECRYGQCRWLMSEGFPADSYLFNYAAAKASDAPLMFLVEGAPDVFRLKELGLVGVAILGKEVSNEHLRKLAALRTMIWVAFDNDEGGTEGRMSFVKRLETSGVRLPHVHFTTPAPYKDFGDTPTVELREAILGRLKGYVEQGQEMVSEGDSRGQRISQYAKHQLEDSLTRMVTAEW